MAVTPFGIELVSEPFLIPVWFYSYSAVIYSISALVSVFVAYFSYKFFRMSKTKSAMMLLFSFLFLTLAFSALAFASVYTYLYKPYFKENFDLGGLGYVNSIGFNLYYITSVIAYLSILLMYLTTYLTNLPKSLKDFEKRLGKIFGSRMWVLYVPLWYLDLVNFHVVSILILAYVALKNVANFYKQRNFDNFLVMFAFLAIVSFHTCLLFVPFDATIYLAANSLLIMGFAALLLMLIRVSGDGKKKI